MSQSVNLIPHTVPPEHQSQEKNRISRALLVPQFFSCIYAVTRCNRSFPCSPSRKFVCVHKPDGMKGCSLLRTNLIFFPLSFLPACPHKRQYNDEPRLCPLSASAMNGCMNFKRLQSDRGKLYTQSFFVN